MNIYTAIRRAIRTDPTIRPTELADDLIKKLTKKDLLPLLVDAIKGEQRQRVHDLETKVMSGFVSTPIDFDTAYAPDQAVAQLLALADESFSLGDGTSTTWKDATVPEHLMRIAMLEEQRAGIALTISYHRAAIGTIEKVGVTCLADALSKVAA